MSKKIRVARVSDLREDQAKLVIVRGREVALFFRGGQYYALDNRCPHQGGPLGEGFFDGDSIICPWHHWDFHLKTGRSRLGEDVCVKTYAVEVTDEEIFIVTP
jgi:nitrite reductase/ring-hydroxylating ferredoxin subunit